MRLKEDYPRIFIELSNKADEYMQAGDYEMCNSMTAELNSLSGILYKKLKKLIEIEQHKQALQNARRSKINVW